MLRFSYPPLLILSLLACEEATPPIADPVAPTPTNTVVEEAPVEAPKIDPAIVRKEAMARLDALKAKLESATAEALLETAQSAEKKQNFKEAKEAYQALALHHPEFEKSAAAVQQATLMAFRLNEYNEGLQWQADAIELFRGKLAEPRLLRVLGNMYLSVPHWGTEKGGEFLRGRHDQGIFQYTYRKDRAASVRYHEEARDKFTALDAKLDERVEAQFDLVSAIVRFTPYDGTWHYWYYAWDESPDDDLAEEEGSDTGGGRHGRWGYNILNRAQPRGVPVDEGGNVVFDQRPAAYAATLSSVEKLKFLLHEVTELDDTEDKRFAATSVFRQALLFRSRDGAERLQRLHSWWWNGSHPFKSAIESKKPWQLADDEVLGLIATHIGVYRVPEDENTLALLRRVVEQYPKSPVAERARLAIGAYYQTRQQYTRAVAEYKAYEKAYPQGELRGQASSAISLITNGEAKIHDSGAQPAGQFPQMTVEHRNLTKVYAQARPLDIERLVERFKKDWKSGRSQFQPESPTYFLQNNPQALEQYAVGKWTKFDLDLPDDQTHRAVKTERAVPIRDAGFWVVELYTDAKHTRRLSRAYVMLETTAVVLKGTKDSNLIWVVDARTGKPVANANIEMFEYWSEWKSNTSQYLHKTVRTKTDASGIARYRGQGHQRLITIEKDGRYAYSGNGYYWQYYPSNLQYGDTGIVFTDRPVYRPLHTVKLRAWVRRRADGAYVDAKRVKNITLRIHDAKGAKVFEKTAKTDGPGAASFEYTLPKGAPLGMYQMDLRADGAWVNAGGNQFRVEEYKAPEIEVKVSAGDGPAKLGEKIGVKIHADYFFGGAVEGAEVTYKIFRSDYDQRYVAPGRWDWLYGAGYGRCYYAYPWFGWWHDWGWHPWIWYPWWGPQQSEVRELVREGTGRLDAQGNLRFEIDTKQTLADFGDTDHKFIVVAEVRDSSRRVITGTGDVLATRNQFFINVDTDRGYYQTGETVKMTIASLLPSQSPIRTKGTVRIARVAFTGDNGDVIEEHAVVEQGRETDSNGALEFTWDSASPGQYRLSFIAKDAWGKEVVGSSLVWVWGPDFDGRKFRFNHLEVITDRRTYAVGDTAKLLISSDVAGAHVLFSPNVDNGHLLDPKVLKLRGKTMVIEVPITAKHVPNFFVEATLVGAGRLSEETREIFVPPPAAELHVTIQPAAREFRAGKPGKLEVRTTGSDGQPVSADVAISVFDKSVLYIQPELTPDVRKHFWGQKRQHRVVSQSSLRRQYPVWEALSRPDQNAAWVFQSANNEWFQAAVGFGNTATLDGSLRGGERLSLAKQSAAASPSPAAPAMEAEADAVGGKRARRESKEESRKDAAGDDEGPMGDLKAKSDRDGRDAPGQLAQPRVRKNFADTAAWKIVKTGDDGRATVDWTFPDNLTTWRIKAIGLTADTRVGEATATTRTTKKLLVRLQAPRFFRERDRVMLSANVHNRLDANKRVKVVLDVTDELLDVEGERSRWVEVEKGGEARVDFWVKVKGEGEARVRMSALADEESDAKELLFPVLVHGMLKTDSLVGSIGANEPGTVSKSVKIRIPEARRPEQTELVVRFSPTLAGAMIDALPFLIDYPYGCTEQTTSRFVPLVITRKALQAAGGLKLEDLKQLTRSLNPQQVSESDAAYKKRLDHEHQWYARSPVYNTELMNGMIASGLARIEEMQRSDGGWGWWGGDRSSVYTTAYVLWGLHEAIDADVAVPQQMTQRGRSAMRNLIYGHLRHYKQHEWVSDTDAFFAYVMSLYGEQNKELTQHLFDRRIKLSVYGKSLLAMALHRLDRHDDAKVVLRNASQFLKEDPENETAWLETKQQGWWYWWNNDVESNAMYLRALSEILPGDPRAPKVVKWLLNHRKNGYYWRSTRDTAVAIAGFAAHMRASRFDKTAYDLEVRLGDKVLKTISVSSKNLLTLNGEIRLKGSELTSGEHALTFVRKGHGPVYFNAYLSYFTLEEDVPAAGLEIKVERKYFKLEREARTLDVHGGRGQKVAMKQGAYRKVPLASGDKVQSGDLILVELMLESKNDYTFLAFEDPKPAGAEPVAVRSGVTYGEAVANMELRDDRVVFFLRNLNQGKLKLDYRLRAEIPGTFHAMPTRGFAMYAPELKANSSEMRLSITDK